MLMIYTDELDKFTQNKSAEDISEMYEQLDDMRRVFRRSCENFLLKFLTEKDMEHPYECEIELEWQNDTWMENVVIKSMWLEDGCINIDTNYGLFYIDGIREDELVQIIENLE